MQITQRFPRRTVGTRKGRLPRRAWEPETEVICNRLSIAHLTAEKLTEIGVFFPNDAEQSTIAAFLDCETGQMDALVEKTEKSIKLLKERRSALITAAVTGKIDVRGKA